MSKVSPKLRFVSFKNTHQMELSISDVLNESRGITYGIVQPGAYDSGGVHMIRSQDYVNGWAPLESIFKVARPIDELYERSRVSKGDILITVVGANIGTLAIVPAELHNANISRSVARISIPLHTAGFYTDGARALRFLRGGDTGRFELLLMKTISDSSGGVRPGLLNIDEINEALTLGKKLDAPMKVYVLYYLYHAAFDKSRYEEAQAYLNEYMAEIESIPKGLRGSVFLDAALFYAIARQDSGRAESYWKQYVPSALLPKAQVLATEAAIANLSGDHAKRDEKIDQAFKEIPNMIDRGVGIALREKLVELKRGA